MPAIRFSTFEKPGKPVIALTRFGARMAQRRPFADAAHGVRLQRPRATLVVVRQELGLVARHVGVRRAVAAAALAGEAQVERLLHLLALPAVGDHLAAQHLVEQPAAAARRIAFFAGRAVARAHGAALGRAALAHADAALGGAREAVALAAEERHARRDGRPAGRRARRAGSRPRGRPRPAHRPACPDSSGCRGSQMRLNSRNASISSGAVHDRQELGAGLAVAVLARERAAVLRPPGRAASRRKPRQCAMPSARAQVEVDARVDAAVAEMAVERGAVAVAVDQRWNSRR